MKLLPNRRKTWLAALFVLLAALVTGPVLAGGWAVVTLDQLPGEIHAGENLHVSFMVRQHGKTPAHYFGDSEDYPIEPMISGRNVETGETIEVAAVMDKSEVGRYYADIVFPSEGEWTWEIAPNPLVGTSELAPLTVLPELKIPATNVQTAAAGTAAPAAAGLNLAPFLRGAAVLLLVAGAATVFLAGRRQEPQTAVVEVGD